MMAGMFENCDAGSGVAPQSCDQTQSRRTFNITTKSLKINELGNILLRGRNWHASRNKKDVSSNFDCNR